MNKLIFLTFMCCLLLSAHVQAQDRGSIRGTIIDNNGQPMEYVTVMLLHKADSSLAKGAISNTEGKFEFDGIKYGQYIVSASMVGYGKALSQIIELKADNSHQAIGSLRLTEEAQSLNEVVVEAQRPMIEQEIDKTVVNVEGSILASGGTAMEVLEKSPGITIDKDDNISLKGKQGVVVMIDGKQTYMSSQEVANMLRNMPSDGIEKLEIITNPSAKYDAAGNSGIINIRTKKNKNMGINGSVTAGVGYGRYEKTNEGLSLNYRRGKLNVFGNYNHRYNRGFGTTELTDRIVIGQDPQTGLNDTSIFNQSGSRIYRGHSHSYKGGIDYTINDKNTIGIMMRGFSNAFNMENIGNTYVTNPADEMLQSLQTDNNEERQFNSNSYNLNYRRTFAREGQELSMDLDYSRFDGASQNKIDNFFYEGPQTGLPDSTHILRSNTPSSIDIKVGKIDYVHPLGEKAGKLELGIKSSYVTTDNDVRFELQNGEEWEVDPSTTNHFIYTENINAAYVNWSGQLGKYGLQLGLRAEQTSYEGESVTLDSVVTNSYLELFPSVFVSRKLNDNHQLTASYSRRIDRPSYQDMNPFVYFLDPYTYFQGNPLLQPQFTNAFQLNHTFKGMYITSLGYSRTTDVFTQVTEQDDVRKVTKATMRNLETLDNFNLGISAPVEVAKWWSINNNLNVFYNKYTGRFLGEELNNAQFSLNFNMNNRFTLPAGFSAELGGMYNSPHVYGIIRSKSQYMVNAGVQRTFWDRKGSLKLSVNDLFNTMRFAGVVDYANMDFQIKNTWESRQARLTFTYRFGNKEVKPERRRSTGSEDEQNRIKMGN